MVVVVAQVPLMQQQQAMRMSVEGRSLTTAALIAFSLVCHNNNCMHLQAPLNGGAAHVPPQIQNLRKRVERFVKKFFDHHDTDGSG